MLKKIAVMPLVLLASATAMSIAVDVTSEPVDEVLLKGTIKAAQSLVYPNNDAKISYSEKARSVHIKFTTPRSYKVNYPDFYLRWRDNQWVVLQEFKKSKIPVERVTVETNLRGGNTVLRFVHLARHVDKYAKLPSDDLWLKTGTPYQRAKGSAKWQKLDY